MECGEELEPVQPVGRAKAEVLVNGEALVHDEECEEPNRLAALVQCKEQSRQQ